MSAKTVASTLANLRRLRPRRCRMGSLSNTTSSRLPIVLLRLGILVGLALSRVSPLAAVDFHIAMTGDDSNPGTAVAPFQSFAAARDAARKFAGKQAVTVHVADGIYYLPETLVFTPADSGNTDAPVVYQAEHEGKAVLSGGVALKLEWKPFRGAVLQASTPAAMAIDQLFVNGVRQRMARYPNYDASQTTAAWQGYAADAFSPDRAARWLDPTGGYIHAMHVGGWGGYHYRITGKNADGTVAYLGGWQNNRQMGMHQDFRMVENIFEELDAPGEWFHDARSATLYFQPEPDCDMHQATVEVVRLRHLIEFQGTAQQRVHHISLKGFVLCHTARTFMDTKEPLLRSDWTIYRGGAVLLTGSEDISIVDSEFDQPGGNAVFVNGYNRRALIMGCHIHDAGASGVCFVGDPQAVRNPLFEYGQTQDLTTIDRAPGPKTEDYPADCAVTDCLINGIGRVERQTAGVQISMASHITVRDTSIYDCARAGINISDGTWGGHLIERCDVFDTVLETADHGSFNSWGRDRFWCSNHRELSEPAVKQDPQLPLLDAIETTVIRNSRWRCDHGWDIDLDDGSSNYEIYQNLLLAGGLKFREGYRRKAWNNIMVDNGFHPHVWFDDSASELRSNILMRAHAPIGQPPHWGALVDRNLFICEADRTHYLSAGCDAHSLSGDPMFVDPAVGDFRVKDASPALQVGFRNFPMDQFGVKKASLRKIARTPVIPSLAHAADDPEQSPPQPLEVFWLGSTLHALVGEEFSAFGVRKEDGGVHLTDVPAGSAAAAAGLRKDDLILAVNGRSTPATQGLFAALASAGDGPVRLQVVRHQKPLELVVDQAPFTAIEFAEQADSFSELRPPAKNSGSLTANRPTHNEPLTRLVDSRLAEGYGAVFANGVHDGAYRLDLGRAVTVSAVNTWSFNEGGVRLAQKFSVYGSHSTTDPGWDLDDRSRFIPLGTIDTTGVNSPSSARFLATSLRARPGKSLGTFRFLIWKVAPVTPLAENTAWQEFAVEAEE